MENSKKNKIIAFILIAIALIATTIIILNNKKTVDAKVYNRNKDIKPIVTVYKAELADLIDTTKYIGTLKPNREINVISETNGRVIAVFVNKGQTIGKGQVIAKVDNDIIQAQLIAAQANYDKAKADVDKYEVAVASDAMPKINLNNAKLGLKSAESQLKLLKKQLSQSVITAPFSGVITQKMFDLGTVIAPGTPLVSLIDIGSLKFTVAIPELQINSVKLGQNLRVLTDLIPDKSFQGKVVSIASQADAAHNFEIEILINNYKNELKAGAYGYTFLNKSIIEKGILIPRSALIGSAKQPQVFVVENAKAILKEVTIQYAVGNQVAVKSGINVNDIVIIAGQINLTNGTTVSVSNNLNK